MEAVVFKNRKGELIKGWLVRDYEAWEGSWRYIVKDLNDKEYRCVKTEDGFVELVI